MEPVIEALREILRDQSQPTEVRADALQRLRPLLAAKEMRERPASWWWLSFANTERFLGVVVIQAHGPVHAIERARNLGINPGGEVHASQLPGFNPPAAYIDRLLSKAE